MRLTSLRPNPTSVFPHLSGQVFGKFWFCAFLFLVPHFANIWIFSVFESFSFWSHLPIFGIPQFLKISRCGWFLFCPRSFVCSLVVSHPWSIWYKLCLSTYIPLKPPAGPIPLECRVWIPNLGTFPIIALVSLTHVSCLFAFFYESLSCVYTFFSSCLSTCVARAACFVFCSMIITTFVFSFFLFDQF